MCVPGRNGGSFFFFLFFLFFLENAGIERLMNSVWKKFRGPSDAVTYHSLDL